jgi:hypothetical protein
MLSKRALTSAAIIATLCIAFAFQLRRTSDSRRDGDSESIAEEGPSKPAESASPFRINSNVVTPRSGNTRAEPDSSLQSNQVSPPSSNLSQVLQLPTELLEIDQAFVTEPVDASWAPETESRVLESIANMAGLQIITIQVECRTSTCRLQFAERAPTDTGSGVPSPSDERVKAAALQFQKFVQSFGLEATAMSVPDRYGTRMSVAYLRRTDTVLRHEGSERSDP